MTIESNQRQSYETDRKAHHDKENGGSDPIVPDQPVGVTEYRDAAAASKTKRTVLMTKGSTWSILCCRLMHVPHTGCNVRFGSKADICSAKRHVRFTPESGHVRCNSGMSALCQ